MIKLIKGFHDILPDETPKWDFISSTSERVLERFGFRKIITPIMEKTELFQRGIGEVTDIVEKEMYTFEDRGGDVLSLRPEATAGILRAIAEHSLLRKDPILKVYTIGPMFRRERPSKGRYRQFFQINAEVLGDDSPQMDADTISAAYTIMSSIGTKNLVMEVNSVGCRSCRNDFKLALRKYYEPFIPNLCEDCKRRIVTNPMRLLDCKVDECSRIAVNAPIILDFLDEPCRDHFRQVQHFLDLLRVPHRLEPRMVRGLDYYTRTAFEIIHDELGRSKAVGGGGRYDNLLAEIGGPDVSGIGFAIGLERLALGLSNDDAFSKNLDVFVATLGEKTQSQGVVLVNELRRAGLAVETRYQRASLKSQMKTADKYRARYVLMLGDDELARNEVTVRNMQTKDQVSISLDDVISYLQGEDS